MLETIYKIDFKFIFRDLLQDGTMDLIMGLSFSLIILGASGVFLSYLNLGSLTQQIWETLDSIGITKEYIRFSTFTLFGFGIALFLIGYSLINLKRSRASKEIVNLSVEEE